MIKSAARDSFKLLIAAVSETVGRAPGVLIAPRLVNDSNVVRRDYESWRATAENARTIVAVKFLRNENA